MNVTEMPQAQVPALRPVNDPDTLCRALIRARKQCRPTVHKGGHNRDQNYSYVGHEQVLVSGARQALLDNDLTLEQRAVEYIGELAYQTRSGTRPVWRWRGTYDLVHVSGEVRTYAFEATTQANDKAAFVASTSLDRVAHLRLLALAGSDEENPEHDSHDRHAQREQVAVAVPPSPAQTLREATVAQPAPEPPRAPEAPRERLDAALEMFLPKLRAQKTPAQLEAWLTELVTTGRKAGWSPTQRRVLWETFAAHARDVKADPDSINKTVTQKLQKAAEVKP